MSVSRKKINTLKKTSNDNNVKPQYLQVKIPLQHPYTGLESINYEISNLTYDLFRYREKDYQRFIELNVDEFNEDAMIPYYANYYSYELSNLENQHIKNIQSIHLIYIAKERELSQKKVELERMQKLLQDNKNQLDQIKNELGVDDYV